MGTWKTQINEDEKTQDSGSLHDEISKLLGRMKMSLVYY